MFEKWCQVPESAGVEIVRRVYLDVTSIDLVDPRHLRSILQPHGEFIDCAAVATGQHLDVSIRKINRVTGDTESLCNAPRAVAEKHSLHAAINRK